jgi:2-polyprenyl-3-methyl-5-hydroxy-6-metoxy-1,4-benzoquinol methylase
MPGDEQRYSLGSHAAELARLDHQAAVIAPVTGILLRAAGIAEGMRVLDLGTGLGHVALMLAGMVGPAGSIVGLDQAADPLAEARRRAEAQGLAHVRFVESDARTWRDAEPFDAIVGRLLLFHLADPVAALLHYKEALRPGGLMVAIDYDMGASRSEPATPLVTRALAWVVEAFEQAGAHPKVGTQLAQLLGAAGLSDIQSFGVQAYLSPDDPAGPRMLTGVIRSLEDKIVSAGIASAAEIGLDTLEERLAAELREAGAVVLPPTVAGAWGRMP